MYVDLFRIHAAAERKKAGTKAGPGMRVGWLPG
jgi:hypothetical protein